MGSRLAWRPRVRTLLAAIVLAPVVTVAAMLGASARSAWVSRDEARTVAADTVELSRIAAARAELNRLEMPLAAVTYAAPLGIGEAELDALLHPSVPLEVQLSQSVAAVKGTGVFRSTPQLSADLRTVLGMVGSLRTRPVPFDQMHSFFDQMASNVDALWTSTYRRLQDHVAAWRPPGSFEVHVSALAQTYQAFLAGGHEIEGAIYVLEGLGPAGAKQEVVQAAGDFGTAEAQFAAFLTPGAQRVWHHITTDPRDRAFAGTIRLAVSVALSGAAPPFAGNAAFAGASMAPGLDYLTDLDTLVTTASTNLSGLALDQARGAQQRLVDELLLLGLLLALSGAAILAVSRIVTRPLRRLADAANDIHRGQFDLEPVPARGPRELVSATHAFNDMMATLSALEGKTIALADEDLTHEALQYPLPGRTGSALQVAVDRLTARMREREVQRNLLNEAATHDPLTGLLNRSAVFEFLSNDVARRRRSGETVAVLFVDLDGLKPLNDQYGHEVGDVAIFVTAMALVNETASCDIVGRLGGDEFLVVLCHDHSCRGADAVDRIRSAISRCRLPAGGGLVPLAASVGVALAECGPGTDPMHLVRQADEAMYEAKKAAREDRELTSRRGYGA